MATDLAFNPAPPHELAAPAPALGTAAIVRCALRGCSPARGSMADAQALLVFDFGTGRGGASSRPSLCRSNVQLALAADRWPELPVLAQAEAATALSRTGRLVVDLEEEARQRGRLGRSAYLSTAHIARAAAALLHEAGWRTVAVLAHPSHAPRCAATVEAAGVRVVMPALSLDDVDFDPASGQWWTRGRAAWVGREMAVLAHHRLTGVFNRSS